MLFPLLGVRLVRESSRYSESRRRLFLRRLSCCRRCVLRRLPGRPGRRRLPLCHLTLSRGSLSCLSLYHLSSPCHLLCSGFYTRCCPCRLLSSGRVSHDRSRCCFCRRCVHRCSRRCFSRLVCRLPCFLRVLRGLHHTTIQNIFINQVSEIHT
jgi:hypothetical protein